MANVGADEQKAMNRETWSALRAEGVAVGEPLEVDAFFFASSENVAREVEAELVADGWAAQAAASKTGLLRRRVVWSVVASRTLTGASLDVLDDMVDRLEALADRHGAEFDGWGAEVD